MIFHYYLEGLMYNNQDINKKGNSSALL